MQGAAYLERMCAPRIQREGMANQQTSTITRRSTVTHGGGRSRTSPGSRGAPSGVGAWPSLLEMRRKWWRCRRCFSLVRRTRQGRRSLRRG
jgi:hypothetical protein